MIMMSPQSNSIRSAMASLGYEMKLETWTYIIRDIFVSRNSNKMFSGRLAASVER